MSNSLSLLQSTKLGKSLSVRLRAWKAKQEEMKKPMIDKSITIKGDVTGSQIQTGDKSEAEMSITKSKEKLAPENKNGILTKVLKYGHLPFIWILVELFTEYGIIQKLFSGE